MEDDIPQNIESAGEAQYFFFFISTFLLSAE